MPWLLCRRCKWWGSTKWSYAGKQDNQVCSLKSDVEGGLQGADWGRDEERRPQEPHWEMTEINTVPQGEKREQEKTRTTEPGDKEHMGSKGENDFQASGSGGWAKRLRDKESMWGRYTHALWTKNRNRKSGVEGWESGKRNSAGVMVSLLFLCNIWLAITRAGKQWSEWGRTSRETKRCQVTGPNPKEGTKFRPVFYSH